MAENLTLGSLFSGSGSFELAGILSGIKPVWLSEIEPFALLVTRKRLPFVKQYGDIRKLDGAKLEPVDIITFGSPCQDMSISGKRAGLEGSRSVLFHEAVRIIREMRRATNGKYPKYIVWENVAGALSSGNGEDFRTVLEELCQIADPKLSVPRPSDRWKSAGEILGDSFSVAWRVLDAQYFGVAQRRRRIYLVGDLAGGRAGKILFESEGLSGYSAEGGQTRQRAAGSSAGGSGASGFCLNDQGGAFIDISQNITGTLRAASNSHEPCVMSAAFRTEESSKAHSLGYETEKSPTLTAWAVPATVYENHGQSTRYKEISHAAPTVTATYGTGGNNQPFVVRRPMVGSARVKFKDDPIAPTLDTKGESPFCDQAGVSVLESFTQDAYSKYSENAVGAALRNSGGMPETLVYSTSHSSHHTSAPLEEHESGFGDNENSSNNEERATKNTAGTPAATDYKDPPTVSAEPCYTVRRLTPTECARLQGLPDWWCKNLDDPNPSEEEIHFWQGVWDEWNAMYNKKPRSESQIRKWLSNPYSDSAEYKLYGNGIALPCGRFVLAGIAWADGET